MFRATLPVLLICFAVSTASAQPPTFDNLRIAPVESSSEAQKNFDRAEAFRYGFGEKRDLLAAFERYLIAAEQGHAEAQNLVGMFYLGGLGVSEDCRLALHWFNRAAKSGEAHALNNTAWVLATCHDAQYRDGQRAIQLALSAIEIEGPLPEFQGTLGAAFAETGDFETAILLTESAKEAMLAEGYSEAAAQSDLVLENFRQGKPWRGALFLEPESFRP